MVEEHSWMFASVAHGSNGVTIDKYVCRRCQFNKSIVKDMDGNRNTVYRDSTGQRVPSDGYCAASFEKEAALNASLIGRPNGRITKGVKDDGPETHHDSRCRLRG